MLIVIIMLVVIMRAISGILYLSRCVTGVGRVYLQPPMPVPYATAMIHRERTTPGTQIFVEHPCNS